MKRLVIPTATLLLLVAAGLAQAQDAHGAIAFAQMDEAVAWGFAWDFPTKDQAETAALNDCLSASGGAACTVLAWFQNGCGALALGQHGTAQGKGARTAEQAETRALASCKAAGGVGCSVVGSECVSTSGEPNTWLGSESVIARAGATDPPEPPPQVAVAALEGPKCAELGSNPNEVSCWEEIAGQPGCYVWADAYPEYRTEDWSGGCAGNTGHGYGSLRSVSSEHGTATATGVLVDGMPQGSWEWRYDDGVVSEGPYVDGEMHGRWTVRWPDSDVSEGPFVNGERHGRWVHRWANGARIESEYRNDSREGRSGVYYTADGERHPGRWSDGCFRDVDGRVRAASGKTIEECRS